MRIRNTDINQQSCYRYPPQQLLSTFRYPGSSPEGRVKTGHLRPCLVLEDSKCQVYTSSSSLRQFFSSDVDQDSHPVVKKHRKLFKFKILVESITGKLQNKFYISNLFFLLLLITPWIRIRIATHADPHHCLLGRSELRT